MTIYNFINLWLILFNVHSHNCNYNALSLGENEVIRTYVEFTDGGNRGMYNPETGYGGFEDEDFDATTSMVINWHKNPESNQNYNAKMSYRMIYPLESSWNIVEGDSYDFWYRDEKVNRVILTDLEPNSVYEYKVKKEGEIFRFRTMPSSLKERSVKIVFTADHQVPTWSTTAHRNAEMVSLQKPDMFVVAGDFVNSEGRITQENANRWALYLDNLYNINDGHLIIDLKIEDKVFENIVIPHVGILGNHETGNQHHLRWPSGVTTVMSEPGYPTYISANWMELLFHWPFKSEGFYSEFNQEHPNMDPEHLIDGYGHAGFGKLSFSNYLMLIALDSNQNWEGKPTKGLKDWEGNLISDKWPWYENHHAEVRQDLWLQNLLEPKDGVRAGDKYDHIIPVWHRGLFGTVRFNMSLKNRTIMEYWLPILYRNGVKFIKEAHDHIYARSIPIGISQTQEKNTFIEKKYYEPRSWKLTENLSEEYIDKFYSVNTVRDYDSKEIVGWEYKSNFITYNPKGFRTFGYGGWAAGRRTPGDRGGGNAGLWFVNPDQGGANFGGPESYHINIVELSENGLRTVAIHPNEIMNIRNNEAPNLIHDITWNLKKNKWSDQ